MLNESFVFFLLLVLWFIMCYMAMLKLCLGFLSVLLALDFLLDDTFSLRLEFGIE